MATSTVSSDSSTPPEQVEKKAYEEVKTMEDGVPQPKESAEKPKEKGVPSATAPSAESEEKIKEKESEPPAVEEVVKAEVEEKPKAEEPIVAATSAEPSLTEDVQKPDIIPVIDIPQSDNAETSKDSVPEVKSEPVEQPGIKDMEKPQEESPKEAIEVKLEEKPKEIEVAESATEVVDKKEEKTEELPKKIEVVDKKEEKLEELPEKTEILESAAETEVVDKKEVKSEELPKKTDGLDKKEEKLEELPEKTEIPESAAESVETKVEQPAELPGKVEIPESTTETIEVKVDDLLKKIEIPESVIAESKEVQAEELPPKEKEVVKDVEVSATEDKKDEAAPVAVPEVVDKPEEKPEVTEQIEDKSAVAEPTEKEIPTDAIKDTKVAKEVPVVASENSDRITSTPEELHVVGKDVEVPPPAEVAEKAGVEDREKEVVAKTDAEESVKVEQKIEKENEEARDEKIEEKGEKTAVVKELTPPEVKAVEDAPNTISQEAGKTTEETSREIELPIDNGNNMDEPPASDVTGKDVEVEKKVDVEEHQKAQTETKGEETAEAAEPKLEQQEKEVKESATTEEPTKETDDSKTVQEAPKKHSNNLLAKVKQSLVKAKKAITGKSQSKTPHSDTKAEVKAT